MIDEPAIARVRADIAEPGFSSGVDSGRWRVIAFDFPRLDFAVTATEPDGSTGEYGFRADLSNFPGTAPKVQIWDHANNVVLPANRRPKGGPRIQKTFQSWGDDTVYRPWDRCTGPHGNNATTFPHLAWRPERRLSFIFEDLYAILNSNAVALAVRTCG